jgi:hypothetical protein
MPPTRRPASCAARVPPSTSPEVDSWLREKKHPLEPAIQRIREVVLAADPRLTEYLKYGTLQFGYRGDLANFVQLSNKKRLRMMFNTGAQIPGSFPHMEGDGPTARFMHFASVDEVNGRAEELAAISRAWCDSR